MALGARPAVNAFSTAFGATAADPISASEIPYTSKNPSMIARVRGVIAEISTLASSDLFTSSKNSNADASQNEERNASWAEMEAMYASTATSLPILLEKLRSALVNPLASPIKTKSTADRNSLQSGNPVTLTIRCGYEYHDVLITPSGAVPSQDTRGANPQWFVKSAPMTEEHVHRMDGGIYACTRQVALVLGPAFIKAAIKLSDEFDINEMDAAALLYESNMLARKAGAKQDVLQVARALYISERREQVYLLQDILRSPLTFGALAEHYLSSALAPGQSVPPLDQESASSVQNIVRVILKERNNLVSNEHVVQNLLGRMTQWIERITAPLPAFEATTASQPTGIAANGAMGSSQLGTLVAPQSKPLNRPPYIMITGLFRDDILLLAECVFLVCYTVQMKSSDALNLREGLLRIVRCKSFMDAHSKEPSSDEPLRSTTTTQLSWFESLHASDRDFCRMTMDAVVHTLFLSWSCALDRTRYRDVYDISAQKAGVNSLLRDTTFIRQTLRLEQRQLDGGPIPDSDPAKAMSAVEAATEVVASVFRLATANPDVEEAASTCLRLCACTNVLEFFSIGLVNFVKDGPGSLSVDADLYADVLEDLAVDLAEGTNIVPSFIEYNVNLVGFAAAGREADIHAQQTSGFGRNLFDSRQLSPYSTSEIGHAQFPAVRCIIVAQLADFISRVIDLNKDKLAQWTSHGGSLRYWTGMNGGFGVIQQIGDAVTEMGDIALRDPEAPGGVGKTFATTLISFENLMTSSAKISGPYAVSTLRYLAEPGLSLVSFERLMQSLSYYINVFSQSTGGPGMISGPFASPPTGMIAAPIKSALRINLVETEALCGLLRTISAASKPLRSNIANMLSPQLPSQIYALAVLQAPLSLKVALIDALVDIGDTSMMKLLLDTLTSNQCSGLLAEIRGSESSSGYYGFTLAVIRLIKRLVILTSSPNMNSLNRSLDGQLMQRQVLPSFQVIVLGASVANALCFVLDEVLANWNRRSYSDSCHRWDVANAVLSLLLLVRNSGVLLTKLLSASPGTGGAHPSLKNICLIAALQSSWSETTSANNMSPGAAKTGRPPVQLGGIQSLIKCSELGKGRMYRVMESASSCACRLLSHLLRVPSAFLRKVDLRVVGANELLMGEIHSLVQVSTLISSLSPGTESSSTLLSETGSLGSKFSHVGMCATECISEIVMSSCLLASELIRHEDSSGLRSSLSHLAARDCFERDTNEPWIIQDDLEEPMDLNDVSSALSIMPAPPSAFVSVLNIVSACLLEQAGEPLGLYLLGASSSDGSATRFVSSDDQTDEIICEHGILAALMERICSRSDKLDDPRRATAASFVAHLIIGGSKRTSSAVMGFIHYQVSSVSTQGSGGVTYGTTSVTPFDLISLGAILEWISRADLSMIHDLGSLGRFMGAVMRLAALETRLYMADEMVSDRRYYIRFMLAQLRIIGRVAEWEFQHQLERNISFSVLLSWRQLLGAEATGYSLSFIDESGEPSRQDTALSSLFDVAVELLDGLSGAPHLELLLSYDSGRTAAEAALLCIAKLYEEASISQKVLGNQSTAWQRSDGLLSNTRLGSLLRLLVKALASPLCSRTDATSTRTALYSGIIFISRYLDLLSVGDVGGSETKPTAIPEGGDRPFHLTQPLDANPANSICAIISRVLRTRVGAHQVLAVEAIITAVAADATSASASATRAAAMSCLAIVLAWDARVSPSTLSSPNGSTSGVPYSLAVLFSQNRLRRMVSNTLIEGDSSNRIARACAYGGNAADILQNVGDTGIVMQEYALSMEDAAALFVAESLFALLQRISNMAGGARVLAESGVLDMLSVVSIAVASLPAFESIELLNMGNGYRGDRENGRPNSAVGDKRARLAYLICGVCASVLLTSRSNLSTCSTASFPALDFDFSATSRNSAMISSVMGVMDGSRSLLIEVLRKMSSESTDVIQAASCICMVLSCLPAASPSYAEAATTSGLPSLPEPMANAAVHLRLSIACMLWTLIPGARERVTFTKTGLLISGAGSFSGVLGGGAARIIPCTPKEARRSTIFHPEGGSLFDRDISRIRLECLKSALGALRNPVEVLSFFVPTLNFGYQLTQNASDGGARSIDSSKPLLYDILQAARASCAEMLRSHDESVRLSTFVDPNRMISLYEISELQPYFAEEFGMPSSSPVTVEMAAKCFAQAALQSKSIATTCAMCLELSLYILREYVRAAVQLVRGSVTAGDDIIRAVQYVFDTNVAANLIQEAKLELVPFCAEIDAIPEAAWNDRGSGFASQILRQIRTLLLD